MLERSAVVAEAREWVGTPFMWQQSVKGRGCDCKGLVVGVARELGLPEADSLPAKIADYRLVDIRALKSGLRECFDEARYLEPSDIILLNVAGRPQHLAIYAGDRRMIHTYSKGPACVIEAPMGGVWIEAIDSIWRWKGIA